MDHLYPKMSATATLLALAFVNLVVVSKARAIFLCQPYEDQGDIIDVVVVAEPVTKNRARCLGMARGEEPARCLEKQEVLK